MGRAEEESRGLFNREWTQMDANFSERYFTEGNEGNKGAVVRSSIPFAYESFDHPRLRQLRARHKLDDLAKGAKTEFELIERLARWSSGCWDRGHLKDAYPPWDGSTS